MPKFEITSPDGKKFEVSAPDGATQDQVLSYAQTQFKQQQQPAVPANTDVGFNAANKAIAGVPDAVLNAPYNVWNLAKAGYGTAMTAAGHPDLAPDITPAPDFARKAMSGMGLIRPEAEPQTAGQRMLDAGVQGATSMAMNPASSGRQLAAMMGTGAASGLAGQGTKEVTGNDTLALTASMAAPWALNAAANGARTGAQRLSDAKQRNAVRDQTLANAQAEGYLVPPSTVQPTATNKVLESVSGKAATQQAVSTKNMEISDALARRAIGLPENAPITPEAVKNVRKEAFDKGYAPLANSGTISTGRVYRQALDDIVSRYQGAARSFPGAVRNDVADMVTTLRRRNFDAGDAIKMTQILRDDASKAFTAGDAALGKANRAAAQAIEDQIELGLSRRPNATELLDNFRQSRTLMAKAHTVEDAIREGSGSIDANKIAAQLQKGAPLTGELKTIGEFANVFRKANQTPQVVGSAGVSKLGAVSSALMGGGGAALGGPAGAAVGVALPMLAPAAAKSLILSKPYQRSLKPNYDQGQIAKLLAEMPPTSPLIQNLLFATQLGKQ